MKTKFGILACTFAVFASPAFSQKLADPMESGTLLRPLEDFANNGDPSAANLFTVGLLSGVISGGNFSCQERQQDGLNRAEQYYTFATDTRALVQGFIDYLNDHPESWDSNLATVAALAFIDTYPCR